ncbi:SAM-dependent methyltransferase [Virgibacillus phasianinus]|uniref:S-adenosyl-L-methionine-dependent methyltransferase n=1 Tax=Virgibacillus phasianinus TaxID=2017483 RepID=A0A220U8E7_9BACI|nr:SAM-dependent methyltransferase [Virgibacillus phasianinus]ASK64141.1 SAM-dependent methyltransferase [Virgibacillus phasianinus]
MKENQISFTAMMTAYIRGIHSKYTNPKIFNDCLGYDLIPEEQKNRIEQTMPKEALMHSTASITRSRYTEDCLMKAIENGVEQYVILGAGLDTFAYRYPDLLKSLHVFELDHPATQNFKRQRVDELGWNHPDNLHYISIDFTRDNLHYISIDFTREDIVTKFNSSLNYSVLSKSFFSWQGVTMYLSKEEVYKTLTNLSKVTPAGSMIVFDYFSVDEFNEETTSTNLQKKENMMNKIGEPMKTGFDPASMKEEMAELGLNLLENLSPVDIKKRYMTGLNENLQAHKNVYFALAEVE